MSIKKIIVCLYCLVTFAFSFSIQAAEVNNHSPSWLKSSYTPDRIYDAYTDDLWVRMRRGFAFDELDSAAIHRIERSYTRSPQNLYRIAERSRRYLYYIVDEIIRRGLPTELAILPIVESAFKPNARSKQNAVGLWQFISSTGKMYGLKQNRWHDDRKDVVAATHAALDYLEDLYQKFGDWKLVIAAYNWGDGAVKRMLARQRKAGRSTAFNHLRLPRETRNHVNKLIAIKHIIANPEDYGVQLPEIANQPYFGKLETRQSISTRLIAKFADITLAEFKALNPAYKKSVIRVTGSSRTILLPVDKIDMFMQRLDAYNSKRNPTKILHVHRVEDIENNGRVTYVSSVAQSDVVARQADNGHMMRDDLSLALQQQEETQVLADNHHTTETQFTNDLIYVAKKGDTFDGISKRFGISREQLMLWNDGNDVPEVGQRVIIMRRETEQPDEQQELIPLTGNTS